MFEVKIFDNNPSQWAEIKETILSLEKEAFGKEAFTEEALKEDFLDTKNIIVLLKNTESNEVVGFAYAKPFDDPETNDSPTKLGETAWIWNIIIQKEYRGKGLSGKMLAIIEEELKKLGFKYLEMNARIANNFANNISKHYKDRIIKSSPLDSRWGPQIFFRIKL